MFVIAKKTTGDAVILNAEHIVSITISLDPTIVMDDGKMIDITVDSLDQICKKLVYED